MKKTLLTLVVVAVLAGSAYGYYNYRKAAPGPPVVTELHSRGDIVDAVGASGTRRAVTASQFGPRVSAARLTPPNFAARADARGTPAAGRSGLSWKGCQRTLTARSGSR
mgnify:CR=1 FL=1